MDNRTIDEVRKNETKLINEIKVLETKIQKYKEVIDKAKAYIEELNKIIPRYWFTKLLDILKEVE